MTKMWKAVLLVMVTISFGAQAQDGEWQEGRHYVELSNPVPTSSDERIEVAEVFWYGCPHCYTFKPLIEEWEANMADDVHFELIPAALGRSWEPHARAYYAIEALDKLGEAHDALFDALARDRRQLETAEALADYLAGYGVDEDEFIKTFNSFGVNAKMQQSQAKIRGARITGTPTMLVNGKYTISATMTGSHENMIKVVDYLVEKERAAQ